MLINDYIIAALSENVPDLQSAEGTSTTPPLLKQVC